MSTIAFIKKNGLYILLLLIFALFVTFYLLTKKREHFFYWKDTPNYITDIFSYPSALFAAQLSQLAYDIGTQTENKITDFMNQYNLKFNPADNLYTYMNTDTAFMWTTDSLHKSLYISFRGTILDETNIQTDLYQTLVPFVTTMNAKTNISQGFFNAWAGIRNDVLSVISKIQPTNVYLTGHSLGGALATLAAFEIKYYQRQIPYNVVVYTFGSPRVGDIGFASMYNKLVSKSYRVHNLGDPIPHFPTTYQGYQHVSELVLLSSPQTQSQPPLCFINPPEPQNVAYNIFEHKISVYINMIANAIREKGTCVSYSKFPSLSSACTGGNSIPPKGYPYCYY